MLWKELVTDGHVRAARLRRIQPFVIALGLILVWAGILIARSGPQIAATASLPGKLQQRLQESQRAVTLAFNGLRPPQLSPAELETTPPAQELDELVSVISKSLTDNGKLPKDDIDFVEMDVDEFWSGKWPPGRVAYVESGDVYLFGALVHMQYGAPGVAARWFGAIKRFEKGWQYTTLAGNGSVGPTGQPQIAPSQIAVSLVDFVPKPPEQPEPGDAP